MATDPQDTLAAWKASTIEDLIGQLSAIRDQTHQRVQHFDAHVQAVHPSFRESARNLLHYLALRSFDIRELQERLARLGLSSLGRTEAHVVASLEAVLAVLHRLIDAAYRPPDRPPVDFELGHQLLVRHTEALFGPAPEGRDVRIMVTFPSEAAGDYALVRGLLVAGMDCVRINCAHDDAPTWERMIDHVHRAQAVTGRTCRILMDLGGPKLRTGPLEPGPLVRRWKPQRDVRGRVARPARLWLAPPGCPMPSASQDAIAVPVEGNLSAAQPGDRIRFRDARDKKRTLEVVGCEGGGCWAEAYQTAYVETGMPLTLCRAGNGNETARIGALPSVKQPVLLQEGETLVLHRAPVFGRSAVRDAQGRVQAPARIACTLPQVFADVRVGEPVKLDDGTISGVIEAVSDDEMHVRITRAREGGSKLRADKSINFPESTLRLSGLTERDRADLDFVARHADIVGLSFAGTSGDVLALQEALAERGAEHLGIMLKIETRRGFQHLPWLLLTAMRSHPVGVMIARGDLAVECGWERLAEVQEEILWLCEAAHVPVVWATQVLEGLAKTGLPSRAEITDAAMAERAECVMLNKGPHIQKAMRTLDDILRRMQAHQLKKTAMLRGLYLAQMQ